MYGVDIDAIIDGVGVGFAVVFIDFRLISFRILISGEWRKVGDEAITLPSRSCFDFLDVEKGFWRGMRWRWTSYSLYLLHS